MRLVPFVDFVDPAVQLVDGVLPVYGEFYRQKLAALRAPERSSIIHKPVLLAYVNNDFLTEFLKSMGPVGATGPVRVSKPKQNKHATAKIEESVLKYHIHERPRETLQGEGDADGACGRTSGPKSLRLKPRLKEESKKKIDEDMQAAEPNFDQLRDLYNREKRTTYWINRAKTDLTGTDRKDVLAFVADLQARERASLWIIRCITALLIMRRQLKKKTYRTASKKDIAQLLQWMKDKNYKPASQEKFRQVLKLFYKTVHGKGRPTQRRWSGFPPAYPRKRGLAKRPWT